MAEPKPGHRQSPSRTALSSEAIPKGNAMNSSTRSNRTRFAVSPRAQYAEINPLSNSGRGPFRQAAAAYLEAGWDGVLPIPFGQRKPPPTGFTGREGRWPSWDEIEAWLEGPQAEFNIALRLPENVIALDVDTKDKKTGDETFADLEKKWGRLPRTWHNFNREDGRFSGHLLFRVPPGLVWHDLPGIEIVRYGHRYCVVSPSVHPDGRTYRWRDPDALISITPPRIDDLPDLLDAWVEGCTGGEVAEALPQVAVKPTVWLERYGAGDADRYVESAVERALNALAEGDCSRHDTARNAVYHLAQLAAADHPGVQEALANVRDGFLRSVAGDPARAGGVAEDEWERMLPGALGYAEAKRTEQAQSPVRYGKLGRVLDRAELASLPKPEPLIDGWLDLRSGVVVVGDTGTNKTFTLLSWACSIATGTEWLGHKVCIPPAAVILVVGEGGSGLDGRIAAWEQATGVAVPREMLKIVLLPSSIDDPEFWTQLTALAAEHGARFVALDTFSSLAPEADETKDAAKVVRRLQELAVAIDGTAVLAHHTGWGDKSRTRGGSQLEANPDGVILLKKRDDNDPQTPVSIFRKKAKDSASGLKVWVQRIPVGNSCALELVDSPVTDEPSPVDRRYAKHHKTIIQVMRDKDDIGLTKTDLAKLAGGTKEHVLWVIQVMLNQGELVATAIEVTRVGGRRGTKELIHLGGPVRLPAEPTVAE